MSNFAKDSETPKARRKACAGPMLAAILGILSSPLFSQSSPKESSVVEKIILRADGNVDVANLKDLVSIKEGDVYSLMDVDRNVKTIFQTGLFSDVRVLRSGEARVELTFVLTRQLTIGDVVFLAEKGLPRTMMKLKLESLRKGHFYSEERVEKAVAELKKFLEQEGYFEPEIDVKTNKNIRASVVDISFVIGSWKRFDIGAVDFEGALSVPEEQLRKNMTEEKGDLYVPSRLGRDLQKLKDFYGTLGFRRAALEIGKEEFDQTKELVALKINVRPGDKTSLMIKGADIPVKLLAPIWEERIFEEWGLAEGESRILTYLRKKGHLFASLKARIEHLENEIRIIYDVKPGDKYKVTEIHFSGLMSFPPSRIKKQVGIGEKVLFFALVDGGRLFEIPGEIETFYQMNGFPECHVDLQLTHRGKRAMAVFIIDEGPRQKIDRVELSGVSMFKTEDILAGIIGGDGRPFFSPNVQRDIEWIETFYLDRGVRGTKVSAEIRPVSEHAFSVMITVSEGRRVRIGGIIIAGNKVTRKKAILREMRIKEGDEASRALILESKRRLEALGIFSEVQIDEMSVSQDLENLIITVREGDRNYASLGVGLETKNEPRSLAVWENDIRLRGTAEFIRNNVFGMASQVSLISQFSLVEKRAVFSWEQHYLLGIPMQTYLNAWLEEENRKSFGFKRKGVSLNVIKSLPRHLLLLGTVSLSGTTLTFLDVAESEIGRQLLPYSTTLASGSVIWDRRDDTINPSRGYFLSGVVEWAYPLFRTESDYLKAFFKFQNYSPLLTHLNLSMSVRLGLGRGKIPIPERFFAGGSNSFRGETFDELGPKDSVSQMPIGGKAVFLVNLEMRFPLVQNLKDFSGAVFYDLGQVFANRKDFSLFNFRGAVGFGLRYKTSLGPVRFDLGWNVDDPEKRGKPLLFITIGNMF